MSSNGVFVRTEIERLDSATKVDQLHGISINIDPKSEHFSGIVHADQQPRRGRVTLFVDLACRLRWETVDIALKNHCANIFTYLLDLAPEITGSLLGRSTPERRR